MRAWRMPVLGDPWEELRAADVPAPEPAPGALRIRVEASDLNFADVLQCRGVYQVKRTPPFTPGMNAAGTVLEAGEGAAFAPGARLVGPTVEPRGGFAEEALVLGAQSHPIPAGVSCRDAMAAHIIYGTAWLALHHRARIRAGETVLVLAAAGGVGTAALDMARAAGCWVVAAAGGAAKTALAQSLGADAVIDYDAEDLYERTMELTDGRGVDAVFDPVGGDYFAIARRLVAWEGRYLVIGFASGSIPMAPANHALVKNYSLLGVNMGGYRQRRPALVRRCYEDLHRRLADGAIKPLVSEVVGFRDLPEALRRLANRQTTGRLLFDPAINR